ncbi:unnamed protein product [Moneuplotes crassus]|uniref:Uncharacterized protein n=1 Tax=Euplotes crassus TaxID=5936 RepID=A0AAD1Y1D0_EUPCR|nr:unnamed protein product [Moneuplotes crassus]
MDEEKKGMISIGMNSMTITFMCQDAFAIILLLTLYLIGKDKTCSVDMESLLIAYIIIKACFIVVRSFLCCLTIFCQLVGLIASVVSAIISTIVIVIYYIIAMINFFTKDHDCFDNAKVHWIALLIITIEALTLFLIIVLIICLCACLIPIFLKMKSEDKDIEEGK